MKTSTIETLIELTSQFYSTQAQSFSATRHNGWEGWERVMQAVETQLADDTSSSKETYSILDLAAGNLRFEHVIAGKFPNLLIDVDAIDGCDNLLDNSPFEFGENITIHPEKVDIINALMNDKSIASGSHNLSCSYGFMHHIPTYELHLAALNQLIDSTKEDGLIAVSFWQFMDDEKFASKAQSAHDKALEDLTNQGIDLKTELDENDYLLGWKEESHTYRYCHHFTDDEVAKLVEDVSDRAELIETYQADGKTHQMNRYIIFKKRGA